MQSTRSAAYRFVHQCAAEIIAASIQTSLNAFMTHLDPTGLDIVDLAVQSQPCHCVHQNSLAECRAFARFTF